jgi:hypothetical protein
LGRRRRKPRLFAFAREVELSHYEDVVNDPDERAALEAVIDAFGVICRDHAVAPETLVPIARGCRHPSMFVRGAAITRLTVLTHYFPEAHDVIEQLCRDTDEELRIFATAALANTPETLAVPLLERCLVDGSWRVRKAAAQTGSATSWPSLLPVLAQAHAAESDARVKVVLQLAIDHQRRVAEA